MEDHLLLQVTSPPSVNISSMQEIELRPWQVTQGSCLWRWRLWLDAGRPFQERKKNDETLKHVERHVAVLLRPFTRCSCAWDHLGTSSVSLDAASAIRRKYHRI
jgi:hypothetical protein